jgi:hypothetical protein
MPAYTSQRTGNWNVASGAGTSPWYDAGTQTALNAVPVSGDTVTVAAGHTVTVPDAYAAVCGDSPAGAGVVLQINGNLTVGGGTSGSIRVKGSADMSGNSQALTVLAGATYTIDGTGNVGQSYTVAVGYQSALLLAGTSGAARATITSDLSGGASPGSITPKTGGFRGGRIESAWGAFSNLGNSGANGLATDFASFLGTVADWKCLFSDTTVANCGTFLFSSGAPAGSRMEITRTTFSGSLGTYSCEFNCVTPTSGGTLQVTNSSFDKMVSFDAQGGLSCTGNYLSNGYRTIGATTWLSFTGNFARIVSDNIGGQQYPLAGDAVGNYWFGDAGMLNWHGVGVSADQDVLIDGNVFEAPGSDQGGDLVMPGIPAGGASRTLTVTRNLALPNTAGESIGKFVSPIGSGTYTLAVEHNTITTTNALAAGESGVATYGETFAGRAGLYSSVRSNIAYTPAGRNPGQIFYRSNTNTVADVVANTAGSVNLGHNAGNNLISATGGGVRAVYGPGYCDESPAGGVAMFSSTTGIGTGDVLAAPAFVDPARNLGKWGQTNQSTDGSVSAALTKLSADPTRIADLLSYVRAGFRPTASAYNGATYSGDAATTDAAGTALTGTVGAMAYFAPGPVVATTYTLSGPTSGMVNAASTNFTVTPDGTTSGTVTPASTGAGTFSPTSLTWTGDSVAKTFTYTPTSTAGSPHSISITSSPVLAYSGSPIAYAVTGPLAAGTASFVTSGTGGISVSATDATNGTAPYAHQWQRSITSGAGFTDLAGKTALTATDATASAGILYYYRLKYTDSAGTPAVIYSGEVPAQLYSGGPIWTGPSNIFNGGLVR